MSIMTPVSGSANFIDVVQFSQVENNDSFEPVKSGVPVKPQMDIVNRQLYM